MTEMIDWKSRHIPEPWGLSENDDLYRKMVLFYYAKCELYDRTLTVKRDRYDETCAFLENPEQRKLSNKYALSLRENIKQWHMDRFQTPFDNKKWTVAQNQLSAMKAQYCIDMCNYYLDNGDEVICGLNNMFEVNI